jgi:hypothetical protein
LRQGLRIPGLARIQMLGRRHYCNRPLRPAPAKHRPKTKPSRCGTVLTPSNREHTRYFGL